MAELIANADGNLTGASTHAACETATGALAMIRNSTATLGSNSNVSSPTFTTTNGKVYDGVLLWLYANQVSPGGTLTVELLKGGVSQASVTVNIVDLPHNSTGAGDVINPVPVFFKYTSTATGDGGSNWTHKLTTNNVSGAQITYSRNSGTAGDFTRALRTTTAVTAAAGDNLNMFGELTGQGTFNRRKITMDSTATTAYGSGLTDTTSQNGGGVRVGCYCELSYGTTASTDYVLQVNGNVEAFWQGNIDVAYTATVTVTIASPGVFTLNSHGMENGRIARLRTTGALPTGLAANTDYYVVNATSNTFQLSTSSGGTAINTSGSQSGTHTLITGVSRGSTAKLLLQMTSSSGDFGLFPRSGGYINIMGVSWTSGKQVNKAKLTANVASVNTLTSAGTLNVNHNTGNGLDAGGTTKYASTMDDNTTNGAHTTFYSGPSINNVTHTCRVWIARGSGTNNRFFRFTYGNNSVFASVTHGFWVDVDLQAQTVSAYTNIGTGAGGTAATLVAHGGGWILTMNGKVATSAQTPTFLMNICSAAGTLSFAGANNTALIYRDLACGPSVGDTTLNIDQDTGWPSGAQIVVGASTKVADECENFVLNANAGASSIVTPEPVFGGGTGANSSSSWTSTHHGVAPEQASVGLLSCNVKVASTSSTLLGYIYAEAYGGFSANWAEFYWLGGNSTNKRGIEFVGGNQTQVVPKIMNFCSMHDMFDGVVLQGNSVAYTMATVKNCVTWNIQRSHLIIGSAPATDWTIDSNLFMRNTSGSDYGIDIIDPGSYTNNIATGATGGSGIAMMRLSHLQGAVMGTFTGNVIHSCNANGLLMGSSYYQGSVDFTIWNNAYYGFQMDSASIPDLVFTNLTMYGNASSQGSNSAQARWSADTVTILGGTICSTSRYSANYGLYFNNQNSIAVDMRNVRFDGAALTGGIGIDNPSGDFFAFQNGRQTCFKGVLNNCKHGATPYVSNFKTFLADASYLSYQKYNQVSGDHRTEYTYGSVRTDTTVINVAAVSMKMTPISATKKLESMPRGRGRTLRVANGAAPTGSVYVRKDSSYNGNQLRVMVRANPALGLNSDTVLATMSAGANTWEQLNFTLPTANDNGVYELYFDCDGTAGNAYVADLAA